jgi:hypothetical protein
MIEVIISIVKNSIIVRTIKGFNSEENTSGGRLYTTVNSGVLFVPDLDSERKINGLAGRFLRARYGRGLGESVSEGGLRKTSPVGEINQAMGLFNNLTFDK